MGQKKLDKTFVGLFDVESCGAPGLEDPEKTNQVVSSRTIGHMNMPLCQRDQDRTMSVELHKGHNVSGTV